MVGTCKRPILAAHCNTAYRALCGVVGHAQATIVEETHECTPAVEAVLYSLGNLVASGEFRPLLTQPNFKRGDKRPAEFVAYAQALGWRLAVDVTLDREQCINALDCLDCNRSFVDTREVKELASCVRPASGLDDRTGFAMSFIEPMLHLVEANQLHSSYEDRITKHFVCNLFLTIEIHNLAINLPPVDATCVAATANQFLRANIPIAQT